MDEFAGGWRGWLEAITPTLLARELPGSPGSFFATTLAACASTSWWSRLRRSPRRRTAAASRSQPGVHSSRSAHRHPSDRPENSKAPRPRSRTVCSPWLRVAIAPDGSVTAVRCRVDPEHATALGPPGPAVVRPILGRRFQIASERLIWPRSMRSSASFAMAGPIGARDAALSMRCGSPQLRTDRCGGIEHRPVDHSSDRTGSSLSQPADSIGADHLRRPCGEPRCVNSMNQAPIPKSCRPRSWTTWPAWSGQRSLFSVA